LVPYEFPSVVLDTKLINYFHLRCMLKDSDWISTKSNSFCGIEGWSQFSTSSHVKMSLALNQLV
jgi:hypothetical protein